MTDYLLFYVPAREFFGPCVNVTLVCGYASGPGSCFIKKKLTTKTKIKFADCFFICIIFLKWF